MKTMILKTASIILFISFIYSCKDIKKKDKNNSAREVEEIEHPHSEDNALTLDNGKLWIANRETTTGIKEMINIMDSFTKKSDVKAYDELKDKLEAVFLIVLKKCTMTGEAHHQLHNFLIPIKDTFEGLSSGDLKQCQEGYDGLYRHLKAYKKYFN